MNIREPNGRFPSLLSRRSGKPFDDLPDASEPIEFSVNFKKNVYKVHRLRIDARRCSHIALRAKFRLPQEVRTHLREEKYCGTILAHRIVGGRLANKTRGRLQGTVRKSGLINSIAIATIIIASAGAFARYVDEKSKGLQQIVPLQRRRCQ